MRDIHWILICNTAQVSILTSSSQKKCSLPHGTREDKQREDYSLGSCSGSGSYGHVFDLPNLPILILYNLPPWLCFKQFYWMMSMLIPRPKSLGINIDVYLQSLVDESSWLMELILGMWRWRRISLYVQYYFGQKISFLHMRCYLVGS